MIKELSYKESREYLYKFQREENSYGTDWYDCEDESATYIWLILIEDRSDKPLGFLSYKKMILPNKVDFVYIVKIYVLHTYGGEYATLFNGNRVSKILFDEIDKKGVNILTLESACEQLDIYYKSLGFKYNKEISDEFSRVIGTREEIMYRIKNDVELTNEEKNMFGDIK